MSTKVDLKDAVTPPKRTIQEIQREYTNLMVKAGQLQYTLYAVNKDLDLVNASLRDLNLEASAIKESNKLSDAPSAQSGESNAQS